MEKAGVKKLPNKFPIFVTIETSTNCSVQCMLKQNPNVIDRTEQKKLSKEEEAEIDVKNEPAGDL